MCLQLRPEDMKKERMHTFVESIKDSGLLLSEANQYKPYNPHPITVTPKKLHPPVKPWSIVDD